MAGVVGETGLDALKSLAMLMVAFYTTCAVFVFVILGTLLQVVTGINVFSLLRYLGREFLLIVSTSSSESALPRLIAKMEHARCRPPVVGIVVPTGYSFNLDGTAIYLTMASLFIAEAMGTPLSIGEQISLLVFMIIASKGAAGVTGAGLATLAGGLQLAPPRAGRRRRPHRRHRPVHVRGPCGHQLRRQRRRDGPVGIVDQRPRPRAARPGARRREPVRRGHDDRRPTTRPRRSLRPSRSRRAGLTRRRAYRPRSDRPSTKGGAPGSLREPRSRCARCRYARRMPDQRTRVAAIDCGTNSIRLLVSDVSDHHKTDLVREMRIVRLGAHVDESGHLSQAAIDRTLGATREYAELIAMFGADQVRFCATSAVRDADNAAEFEDAIEGILGVRPVVLAGLDEARASFLGATRDLEQARTLVVDIGGGSTELVVGTGEDIEWSVSLDVGSVRLTERFLSSDPASVAEVTACMNHLDGVLAPVVADLAPVGSFVGVAGTITTVAAHSLALRRTTRRRFTAPGSTWTTCARHACHSCRCLSRTAGPCRSCIPVAPT